MSENRDQLTPTELEQIVNRLAWRGVEAEEEVQHAHSIDRDDVPRLMAMHEYEWDSDQEVWASTRSVWSGVQ